MDFFGQSLSAFADLGFGSGLVFGSVGSALLAEILLVLEFVRVATKFGYYLQPVFAVCRLCWVQMILDFSRFFF